MASRQASRSREKQAGFETRWRPWFFVAVAALGASALVFVIVLVGLASDGGGSGGPSVGLPMTSTATPADRPDPTPTTGTGDGTPPTATEEPGETPPPNNDGEGQLLACGDIMAPLNKQNALGPDCEPNDLAQIPAERTASGTQYLRVAARDALLDLMDAAGRDGFDLYAVSAYRSYDGQVAAYNSNLSSCGGDRACADRISAHPGHSEHQLGTTVDVSSPGAGYGLESFVGTPDAAWVEANAWRFGFVVSYPEGTEHITGYAYEPWHIRWIGRAEAQRVHESGLTLHEYLARR